MESEQTKDSSPHKADRLRCVTESSTTSSGSSYDSDDSDLPTAPDGGWGWFVVFGSFLCHLLADGFAFSFGVLYKELLESLGDSKSKTSWIGSLFFGVPMMLGPLSGFLTSKYGCRKVTMVGGFITAAGFVISSFMNSVELLCFTFGCIAGVGLSFIYIPAIVVVAFYFERRRALTTGLAVCGSGIGTFVIAPLTEYLLKLYGWRGTMLIWGGMAMNLVICGAMFRPLKFSPREKFQRALETFDRLSKAKSPSRLSLPDVARPEDDPSNSNTYNSMQKLQFLLQVRTSHSVMQLPTYLQDSSGQLDMEKILSELRNNNTSVNQLLDQFMSSNSIPESFEQDGNFVFSSCESVPVPPSNGISTNKNESKKEIVWRRQRTAHTRKKAKRMANLYEPMKRKDIFYRGNLLKLPAINPRATSCPDLHMTVFHSESIDSTSHSLNRMLKNFKKMCKEMIDMSVVRNPLFLFFTLSNFILYFWYDVPYMFLVDKAVEDGIDEKRASFLISVAGIVNSAGQIVFGLLGDWPRVNTATLYAFSIMLCGVCVALFPLFTTYAPLATLAGLFGLFISANYSLCTILLVDFVGMNKLTNAYGLLMMNLGIANLIGPPVAGLLYDVTGIYDYSFYSAGLSIILSGTLVFLCPLYKWCSHKRPPTTITLSLPDSSEAAPLLKEKLVLIEMETVV